MISLQLKQQRCTQKSALIMVFVIALAILSACVSQPPTSASTGKAKSGFIPVSHPDELDYKPRILKSPAARDYQHQLNNGNVAYIVEDHSLPLVQMTIFSPAGAYMLDHQAVVASGMASTMLRDGGTRNMTPEQLDERIDFLASSIGFGIGQFYSSASVNSLTGNFDESLGLLFEMLTQPAFDTERLQINKERSVEVMRQRNDDTRSIEPRVWSDVIYGEDFYINRRATAAQVRQIDRQQMQTVIDQVFTNGNLVISISGDVDANKVVTQLNEYIAMLPVASELPAKSDSSKPFQAGLYGVMKDDVNQTRVSIGHPGVRHGHADEYAIRVMNDILGGGGFTSRITSRVRSDEGLAYSAGSRYQMNRYYDGQFRAAFQSKNISVSQAVKIVLEEIDNIRNHAVTAEDLATAIESQVSFVADLYSSADRMANRFARDDLNQEDEQYWQNYEANIRAVTVEDVQRVAKQHLHPDQLRILLVGNLDEAEQGNQLHGSLSSVTGLNLTRIPLKDPLTLEILE